MVECGRMFNSIKLIYLVKERESLYDPRHEFHKNKEYTSKLWQEIASLLRVSEREAKAKWQNLRSNYMREKRKLDTPGPKVNITWPYFNLMSFLDEFSRMYKGPTRAEIDYLMGEGPPSPEYIVPDDEDRKLIIDTSNDDGEDDQDIMLIEGPSSTSSLGKRPRKREYDEDKKPYLRIEKYLSNMPVDTTSVYYKRSPHSSYEDKSNEEVKDPDMLFLRSLLPSIKELTPLRNLEFKEEVLQLLKRKLMESVSPGLE